MSVPGTNIPICHEELVPWVATTAPWLWAAPDCLLVPPCWSCSFSRNLEVVLRQESQELDLIELA